MQRFAARERYDFGNGIIGFRPGGPFDCLGPYAKILNCPIEGTTIKRAAYATGYADTYFTIPACTRIAGKYISGFFTMGDGAIRFVPHEGQLEKVNKRHYLTITA